MPPSIGCSREHISEMTLLGRRDLRLGSAKKCVDRLVQMLNAWSYSQKAHRRSPPVSPARPHCVHQFEKFQISSCRTDGGSRRFFKVSRATRTVTAYSGGRSDLSRDGRIGTGLDGGNRLRSVAEYQSELTGGAVDSYFFH